MPQELHYDIIIVFFKAIFYHTTDVYVDTFRKRHRRKVPICHFGSDKVTKSTT